jgi:molybdenum cofactor cytidylyltransferase
MRTVAVSSELGAVDGVVCHDVRNPRQRNEVLVRKGSRVTKEDVDRLLESGVEELHIAVPAPDDVGENEAATRLADAVAGPGVEVSGPGHGQVSLVSTRRGVLRVRRALLDRINDYEGVLVLTGEAEHPVDTGMTLGVVKCAPLFMPESTLQAIEDLGEPTITIDSFTPLRVGMVAPRDRLRGGFERSQAALSAALAWYGSSLDTVIGATATVADLAAGYSEVLAHGAHLILAAGASGTDPLDAVFEGLRCAGGEVDQIGIPAEPGTACWIGHVGRVPVLGLASCELFGQPGALDLLLPRLHTDRRLDQRLLKEIALGGLLLGPSRVAPYHARD